ncbi:MAG: SusC/RagA family TonB-linked outer membrane protein [Prolixibacteraceae bacterium]
MKKNSNSKTIALSLWKKLRIMRYTLLLVMVCLAQVFAKDLYSQQTRFNLSMSDTRLGKVLDEIENQSEYYFLFNQQQIDMNKIVTVSINDKRISEVLDVIFDGTDVHYVISDRQIVLTAGRSSTDFSLNQQKRKVSGNVTDTSGQPLPGVTIVIKGTTIGTITDINGDYLLEVPANGEQIVFSFVGMRTVEMPLAGRSVIHIKMEDESIGLEEVVAVGYGTMKKSDLTGAIAQVKADKLEKENPGSVQDILRANIPGLNVGVSTNAKGGGSLEVRGPRSLKANNSPLIVMDGVIFFGELSEINPNDIEQIDVLKDASAAAVYGAKSAAGVVLITTRRGKESKPTVRFDASLGLATMGVNMDVYDAEGYLNWRQKVQESINANAKPGEFAKPTEENLAQYGITLDQWLAYRASSGDAEKDWLGRLGLFDKEVENYFAGRTYDWYDASFQNGLRQDYNASISGKKDGTSYYWSLGYIDNEGIIAGDRYNAYRSNLKLDAEINDWFAVGASVNFQDRAENGQAVDWAKQILNNSPYSLPYDENGKMVIYPMGTNTGGSINSLFDISYRKRNNVWTTLNTVLYAKVKLPFNITYQVNYSPRWVFHNFQVHESSQNPYWKTSHNGMAQRQARKNFDWQVDNLIKWAQTFNDKHKVEVTLLQNAEQKRQWEETMTGRDFSPSDILGYHYMDIANMLRSDIKSYDYVSTADALMARLFYSFDEKYMITASVRRDGYSAFGQNNPRATFPSVALGWVFSEESFFRFPAMNYGKLRLSWGENGNRDVDRYLALSNMTLGSGKYPYVSADGQAYELSQLYVDRMANPNLRWETTTSYNAGIDFGFLENRINGSLDIYKMSTTDLLVDRKLPDFLGFNAVATNLGEVQNKGFELSLNTRNMERDNFVWTTSLNFSLNRNKIVHLYYDYEDVLDADGNIVGNREKDDKDNKWFIGHDIASIWDYDVTGVWQLGEEEEAAKYGVKPGDVKIRDVNGDYKFNNEDKVFLGSTSPKFRWTLRNEFTLFKNFDLSFMMYSYWGHKSTYDRPLNKNGFIDRTSSYVIGFWTPDDPTNKYARLYSDDKNLGAKFIRKKSFIRLDNISFSYNVPKRLVEQFDIVGLRIYGSVRNVAVWAPDWDYWDVEQYQDMYNDNEWTSGPSPRIFTIGVNLTL